MTHASALLGKALRELLHVDEVDARRAGDRFGPELGHLPARVAERLCTALHHPSGETGERACCERADIHAGDAPPLCSVWSAPIGVPAVLVAWAVKNVSREEVLSALGLHAGAKLTVRQRRPTVVLSAGETEIALERRVAEDLWVVPLP